MKMRIKNLNDIKVAYGNVKARYKTLLPQYREIYQKYYPEEYEKLKRMTEDGSLPQYTYEERNTGTLAYKLNPKDFPGKENWGDLPANFYDPINLRTEDPDFCDKFNYYGWDNFGDKKLPHFEMSKSTASFLCMFDDIVEFLHSFEWAVNDMVYYIPNITGRPYKKTFTDLDRYIDSRTVHYDNEDIIITDPCYVIRDGGNDDWEKCNYGSNMEALGSFTLDKYATADTLYGDWGCTTYDADTNEEIGQFCADAGLVSVFSLKQVQKYNPEYDPTERPWCVTLIKNFTGDVTLATVFDEESCEIIRYVDGKGSVNFIGTQTEA